VSYGRVNSKEKERHCLGGGVGAIERLNLDVLIARGASAAVLASYSGSGVIQ
jgi:hypothetical protein